jgi:hypothetical protein
VFCNEGRGTGCTGGNGGNGPGEVGGNSASFPKGTARDVHLSVVDVG